jgi:hypothetical protein
MDINNRPIMLTAAVSLLPLTSSKPLHQLTPDEEKETARRAARLAQAVATALGHNFLTVTTETLAESVRSSDAAARNLDAPEWIRLPKKGVCPYTQLSRSKIYQLITPCAANGYHAPVRSVSLRQRGAAKGTRLVNYDSLVEYIRSHETQGP